MVVKVDEEVRQLVLGGILGDVAVNLPALDLNRANCISMEKSKIRA